VAAELVERGSLHRENSPIRIIRRVGAAENIERLLEIAIVGQRAAVSGEQRLVAGMGDGGLLEHGDGLGALSGGAERLAVAQGRVGILGVAAITLAIDFNRAARVSVGTCLGL
jgi:hypothetical protein